MLVGMIWVRNRDGFTIVELLIVVVVIAVLASVIVVVYGGIRDRARTVTTTQSIKDVFKRIELFNAENGRYPLSDLELSSLNVKVSKSLYHGGANTFLYCYLAGGDKAAIIAAGVGGAPANALWYYSSTDGLRPMTSTQWGSSVAERCLSAMGVTSLSITGITATNTWSAWTGAN